MTRRFQNSRKISPMVFLTPAIGQPMAGGGNTNIIGR
jgi:hypothetical protein